MPVREISVENGKQDEFMKCIIPEMDEPFWVRPPWSSNSSAVGLFGASALICWRPDDIEITGPLLPPPPHPADKMHKPKTAGSEARTFIVKLFFLEIGSSALERVPAA
jgi:hypothetical protein